MLQSAVSMSVYLAITYESLYVTALNTSNHGGGSNGIVPHTTSAESYFREQKFSNILYAHISVMLLSWVVALPICMVSVI